MLENGFTVVSDGVFNEVIAREINCRWTLMSTAIVMKGSKTTKKTVRL